MSIILYLTFIFTLLTFSTIFYTSAYTPCTTNCWNRASEDQLTAMTLTSFKTSFDDFIEVPIKNASELLSEIDPTKPTHFYAYGWLVIQDPGSVRAVVESYISQGLCNIILINWSEISNSRYSFAANSVIGIGFYLANAINSMVDEGLDTTDLCIVGHSLGAQIAGFTGRYTSFTVPRIMGLDPAGPLFSTAIQNLASGDAAFVCIIHTDRGALGIDLQTGHVNFYPNDGRTNQPGCLTLNYCSHYRAVHYYIESMENERAFVGRRCDSDDNLIAGSCNSNEMEVMGFWTPNTARGRFHLRTNNASPFGFQEAGATF